MQLGDVLDDRFVIEERVGKGGIGTVFRAWDLEREQPVAVKLLTLLSPTDLRRFERESRLLAEARIDGIVQHVGSGSTPQGAPYLVMQWLEGETVAKRMEHRGFDVADSVALVASVCRPLATLHARGLVHRDLKPENLILTSERASDVVVIDFGLARNVRTVETRLTATGVALGTPGYMAPEQVRGGAVGPPADVFALGCILYEALTGYAAFAGENYFAVRAKVLLSSPPPLRTLCPEAPVQLVALIEAMIAKPPDARPASAAEVATQLAKLGAIEAGVRRPWNVDAPATARHATLPPTVITEVQGVAVVQLREALGEVALAGIGIESMDDGALLLTADRADPARTLARAVLSLGERVDVAAIVVGTEAITELVDRASQLLEERQRARVVARETSPGVFADRSTAGALEREFATTPAGRSAIRVQPRTGS